jgi:tetratricopeptide (TPR) repeat protein
MIAEAAIDIRAERYDEARATVERVRSLAGDTYTAARVYEAEIAYRMKQTRRAYELYRDVAQIPGAPAFAGERATELQAALFNELLAGAQAAQDAEAARLLREALAINAGATEARVMLVQRLVGLKQYDEARRELEPLLATDPARDEVQEALAEIDLGRGRFEDAIKRYDRLARKTGNARYATRLNEIKTEWSAANMPSHYRYALDSDSLTRADFAVLLYWTVPSVRFARNLSTPPIAIDIADVAGREEIIRAIAIGLYEVDAVTRRVSPARGITAARLTQLTARVLSLRGAGCARQVPAERDEMARAQKVLTACGVSDPTAGVAPDTPATGRMAQRTLEQVARVLGQ